MADSDLLAGWSLPTSNGEQEAALAGVEAAEGEVATIDAQGAREGQAALDALVVSSLRAEAADKPLVLDELNSECTVLVASVDAVASLELDGSSGICALLSAHSKAVAIPMPNGPAVNDLQFATANALAELDGTSVASATMVQAAPTVPAIQLVAAAITTEDAPAVDGHLGPCPRVGMEPLCSAAIIDEPLEPITEVTNISFNFASVPRQVLQELCKKHNIRANMKNSQMVDALHVLSLNCVGIVTEAKELAEAMMQAHKDIRSNPGAMAGQRSSKRVLGDEDSMGKAQLLAAQRNLDSGYSQRNLLVQILEDSTKGGAEGRYHIGMPSLGSGGNGLICNKWVELQLKNLRCLVV